MNPVAAVTTAGVTLAALVVATVLAARAVSLQIDSAICAASDELTLDHDA